MLEVLQSVVVLGVPPLCSTGVRSGSLEESVGYRSGEETPHVLCARFSPPELMCVPVPPWFSRFFL